jgi:uncharacterized protein YdeI (YjbR/CyaY-like superfamily)
MKATTIEQYVANAEPFAIPVLKKIRSTVLSACPDCVETIKWGFPHFMYKNKILCSMASFKQHCAFGFWLGSLMKDPEGILEHNEEKNAMGNFGRITSVKELPPPAIFKAYIRECMALIDAGAKLAKKPVTAPRSQEIPADLLFELRKNKKAMEHFQNYPPSHKREYIEWIVDAKREETRLKRIRESVKMISEGKSKNWKYESKK